MPTKAAVAIASAPLLRSPFKAGYPPSAVNFVQLVEFIDRIATRFILCLVLLQINIDAACYVSINYFRGTLRCLRHYISMLNLGLDRMPLCVQLIDQFDHVRKVLAGHHFGQVGIVEIEECFGTYFPVVLVRRTHFIGERGIHARSAVGMAKRIPAVG